jgi:hypothetical protein
VRNGEHRQTAVLKLGLSHPVEVKAHIVNLAEAKRVEAYVSGHGAVQLYSRCKSMHMCGESSMNTLAGLIRKGIAVR